jgi:hypothetical protein
MHVPPQLAWPVIHTHVVPEHTPPVGQETHAPPQSVKPDSQVNPHVPLVQVAVALAGGWQSAAVQQLLVGMQAPLHSL